MLLPINFVNPRVLSRVISGSLKTPLVRNANEWAVEHRVIPNHYAESGQFDPGRTPYVEGIADAFINPKYKKVVAFKASQMGLTEFLLNIIGQIFCDDPSPTAYVAPSRKLSKSMSTERFMDMARACPELFKKIRNGEDSEMFEKFINGAALRFTWSSSATECASHPFRYVLIDELDRMVQDVEGEGDPVTLFFSRMRTFFNSCMAIVCTPTIKDSSPVETQYLMGTQQVYNVPCPHCHEYYAPSFKVTKWDNTIDEPEEAAKTAHIECPNCEGNINNAQLKHSVQHGRYKGPNQRITTGGEIIGKLPDTTTASFKVSGLCSPWNTITGLVTEFLEANSAVADRLKKVQAVINTGFGELFEVKGDAPEWQELYRLKQNYPQCEVPESVITLVAGVDIQGDCIKYVVRGFNKHTTSYLVDYGVLFGDTNKKEIWDILEDTVNMVYEGINGNDYHISRVFIDSGWRTHEVYKFCKRNKSRFIPVKGYEKQQLPVISTKVEVSSKLDKKKKTSLKLVKVWDDFFKGLLYDLIDRDTDEHGAFLLCRDVSDTYLKEITAEEIVTTKNRVEWIKKRTNDFLDCEKYILAGALYVMHIGERKKKKQNGIRVIKGSVT